MNSATGKDYVWAPYEEPHAARRRAILAAHPEVKTLMGYDWRSKYMCLFMISLQLCMTYFVRSQPWYVMLAAVYLFGAIVNHSLLLALHELSHNLMFKAPLANRLFALFVNTPMLLPAAITFKKYHTEHHKQQGVDMVDVDIPTALEAKIFRGKLGKLLWVSMQGFFYALRPVFIRPKPFSFLELANWTVCLAFNFAVYHFWGGWALGYLALCDIIGMGLHPCAGHFIAEHFLTKDAVVDQDDDSFGDSPIDVGNLSMLPETMSYYGPMRWVIFNVGLHVEHHDFPSIPGGRLWQLRDMAPEFYEGLPYHTSYSAVIWKFITDDSVTLFSRVKRQPYSKSD